MSDVRNRAGSRPRWTGPSSGLLSIVTVVLVLGGCDDAAVTAPSVLQLDELTFRASVDVRESFPVQLGFRLAAHNVSEHEVVLIWDGCSLRVRAYREPERAGRPAWKGPTEPCAANLGPVDVPVPAGDSVVWNREFSAADVLGDSLPDGRYYFTTGLGSASLAHSENVREIEVRAGEAVLAVPR